MELWKVLEFVIALVAVIACISIILHRTRAIEKAEEQEWKEQLEERIKAIR